MNPKTDLFTNLFTGKDNQTHDIGRLLWAVSVLAFLGMSFFAIWRGQAFDPVAWGTAIALVLAGGGASVAIKSHTEPSP